MLREYLTSVSNNGTHLTVEVFFKYLILNISFTSFLFLLYLFYTILRNKYHKFNFALLVGFLILSIFLTFAWYSWFGIWAVILPTIFVLFIFVGVFLLALCDIK